MIIFVVVVAKKCLSLWKDNWEKFNETSLPGKEDFYSHLNMEDITDANMCMQKKCC